MGKFDWLRDIDFKRSSNEGFTIIQSKDSKIRHKRNSRKDVTPAWIWLCVNYFDATTFCSLSSL